MHVPEVIEELTTRRVLTSELVTGLSFSEFAREPASRRRTAPASACSAS